MKRFVQSMDQFGAPFIYNVEGNQKMQKSILGGILSLAIYVTSLLYFIYVLKQWNEGRILPKVQMEQYRITDYKEVSLDDVLDIEYKLLIGKAWRPTQDIFNEKNAIFLATIGQMEENQYIDSTSKDIYSDPKNCKSTEGFAYPLCIREKQSYVSYDGENPKNSKEGILTVRQCPFYTHSNCASLEAYNEFMKTTLLASKLTIKLKEYDSTAKTLVSYNQEMNMVRDSGMMTFYTIQLQITILDIYDGFLLPQVETKQYISGVQTAIQYSTAEYIQALSHGMTPQFYLRLQLNPVYIKKVISYPQLGEVLATIGSIYSMLLVFSFIASFFNRYTLESTIQFEIIKCFFPDIEKIRLTKDWKGKLLQARNTVNNEKYDPNHYKEMMSNLDRIACQKTSILNMCYEISRIQFLLQSFLPAQAFSEVHKIGISLPLQPILKASPDGSMKANLKINHSDSISINHEQEQLGQSHNEKDLEINSLSDKSIKTNLTTKLLHFQDISLLVKTINRSDPRPSSPLKEKALVLHSDFYSDNITLNNKADIEFRIEH